MVQPWRTAVLRRIEDETYNTRRFFFEVPELERFDFAPGQFVTLDLPIDEKPTRRWRSYSIASPPDSRNGFELLIVKLEGGKGSTWMFDQTGIGTEIIFRGAQGVFVLPQSIEQDLYFICTGTGIAPFRSMAHHIHTHRLPHQNIYLIFGTRKSEDLLYRDELQQLQKELEGFHFLPTLSREDWPGLRGYVHGVYEDLLAANGTAHAKFYLCGWKAMVDEAKRKLLERGVDKKAIHLELYG